MDSFNWTNISIGLTWAQQPLLPAEDREEVCLNDYEPDPWSNNHGDQRIYMEEEIEGPVVIAKINYQGKQIWVL